MRPIPSPASGEAYELLKRAKSLLEKAEKLDMVEHEGKKVPAFAADGKGAKDMKSKGEGHEEKIVACLKKKGGAASLEECAKECGVSPKECKKIIAGMDNVQTSKHGDIVLTDSFTDEELDKMGCMGKASVNMKKGSQHKIQTFNTNPETTQFMIETGGNTYHQQYSTNNSLLDSEDVANKGASSSTVNLESLNRNQNPHDNPAPGHMTEG